MIDILLVSHKKAAKMQNPTQQLKNIRLVIKGDINKWLTKVSDLVEAGADIRVLDDYKGRGSIVTAYALSGIDSHNLCNIARTMFTLGVLPTVQVFVDCLIAAQSNDAAEVVFEAAQRMNMPVDVNKLIIYNLPVQEWVATDLIRNKYTSHIVTYLMNKGLTTSTKTFSIDDIAKIMSSRRVHM